MNGGCPPWDIGCKTGEAFQGAVNDAIQNLADAVTEALGKALASLGTLWVNVGTPNLTTSDGGSTPSEAVAFIQDSLWFYMAGAAVLAVLVGGARMAWERRAEPGRELLKSLLTLVVVSGAGLTGIALAVGAADGFAQWIIDRSTEGTSFGTNITALIALTSAASGGALGPLLVIILGLVAILASFVQIMLMVVRGGMLVILAGILPLAASFTSTEMGRQWFKKCLGWTLAFILYKPAAAVIYATAFRLTGTDVFGDDGSGLMNVLVGLVLMVLALFALPALLRFVTPAVSQLASGAGGAAVAGAGLAAMPTGAMALGAAGRGAGTAGSGGGAGGAIPSQPGGSSGGSDASGAAATGGGRPATSGGGAKTGGTPMPTGGASAAPAGGAAASGGTAGGAAAGPAGLAVIAADGARRGVGAARQAAQNATGDEEGPRGSND
jgi:type IV secretion system protein TrbL